jgi:hypothetical protein
MLRVEYATFLQNRNYKINKIPEAIGLILPKPV